MSPNSQTTRSGSELSDVYSGFLVVQLAESAGSADLLRLNSLTDVDELAVLLNKFGVTETQRLIANTSPDQILDLERGIRSKTTGAAPDPSLASFWLIDARHLPDPSDLVTTLRMIAPVRLCYRERKARNPMPVDASDDPLSYTQDHLDAGPVGVNARWAWKRDGGDGSLVHLVDLEQGWHFTHQDLPVLRILPGVPAAVDVCSRTHGTMVVGVAAALDNDKLIVGVAPNTAWVGIASHYVSGGGDCQNPEVGIVNGRVAQAITRLLLVMPQLLRPGDVLLLEVQSADYHPIEMEYANFVAIRAATQAGLVVVEAAGNGDLDLDQLADPQSGFNPCDRKRVDWSANGDSGAIFVAAGQPTYSFIIQRSKRFRWLRYPTFRKIVKRRLPVSNYGSRIDCYASGAGIVTTVGSDDSTWDGFGATSGAAAIIGGTAVSLQSMSRANSGNVLTSQQMRDLFSVYGTKPFATEQTHIGVMPDLRMVANALGIV